MLYIVRHGQTQLNTKNVYNGRLEDKLNETGIQMAIAAGERLKGVRFDAVFVSPLSRTQDTAKYILSRNIYPVCLTVDERIIERDTGLLTGKPFSDLTDEERKNFYSLSFPSDKYKMESTADLIARGADFISYLKQGFSGKNVLVVTHNGILRALRHALGEMPGSDNIGALGVDNATVLEYDL